MKRGIFLLFCSLNFGMVFSTFATAMTGSVYATLKLTTGCMINGQAGTAGVNFGTLNFGSNAATFDTISATLIGSAGSGIYIRCTTGQSYNVRITSSNKVPVTVHGAVTGAPRYLLLDSDNSQGIAYTLYSDATFTKLIANNSDLPSNDKIDPVLGTNFTVYGRVVSKGFNPDMNVGTYTDTINIAVNY